VFSKILWIYWYTKWPIQKLSIIQLITVKKNEAIPFAMLKIYKQFLFFLL